MAWLQRWLGFWREYARDLRGVELLHGCCLLRYYLVLGACRVQTLPNLLLLNPLLSSSSPSSTTVCKESTPPSVSALARSPVWSLQPPRRAISPSGQLSPSASSPAQCATGPQKSSTGSASTTRSISSPSTP